MGYTITPFLYLKKNCAGGGGGWGEGVM